MKTEKYKNQNIWLMLLFLWIWCSETVISYVVAVIARLPIVGQCSQYIYPAFAALCLIVGRKGIKLFRSTVFYGIWLMFAYCISYLMTPENAVYLDNNIWRITVPFLMLVLIQSIDFDDEFFGKKLQDWFYIVAVLVTITSSAYLFYYKATRGTVEYDNAPMAYIVLASLGVIIIHAFVTHNMFSIITSIIGSVSIVAYGARGPCLCLAACIVLQYIFNARNYKRWIAFFLIAFLLAYYYNLFDVVLKQIQMMMEKLGLSNRVFDFLNYTGGKWDSDRERDIIYYKALQAIKERPFLGYGILGDRAIIGGWVHSIIYELWIDFGVIRGTVVLIVLGVQTLRGLFATRRNTFERGFILSLVSITIVMFFFSGSLWVSSNFFMMLGFCSNMIRRKKANTR